MLEIFAYEFLRNALIAGVLASIICGITGTFVIVKKMVSLSGGISHAAFGGIGIGYFFGFEPIAGAALFSLATAGGINYIRKKAGENLDTLVGAVWSGGMALGIMLVYMSPGYAPGLMTYLFGNILLVPASDIILIGILALAVIIIVAVFFSQMVAVTFDEEYATVMNLSTDRFMLLLLCMIALTVVVLIQIVGIILVIALLTLPAAIAHRYSSGIKNMMIISAVLGAVFTTTGIMISYYLDVPSGAAIILLSAAAYLAVIGKNSLKKRIKSPA
ncbi:metal ABC transporter permease [Methanoplanus limicola]|uniref:ABC-type transporter, integral membrane subunit n=1 Tax=Methanoplanus limicola DSM 2279 TaxID=937775 RepID=H1Z3X4_9EURY|nr:metal ABC transporter permease [Methanoplanus limicola]EHQ36596.1 ABC-type transporter, integral membrane subunit [Methanoplanus limicola DSM 2279]